MKNGILLLLLFVSFGLNATCHRYNYKIETYPTKTTYMSGIFYCVNNIDGTLVNAANLESDEDRIHNRILNEGNQEFSYKSRTEYSEDKKTVTIFLDWTSTFNQNQALCTVNGTVTFRIYTTFGAYVYDTSYDITQEKVPSKINWNVIWDGQEY